VRHDPAPSVVGQGVVVSTLITTSDGGSPTGSVSITDGIDGCTAVLPQGFCLWVPGTAGSKQLVATHIGDVRYPAGATSVAEGHDVELPGATERMSLAFDSDASNLAPGAEEGRQNVFQRANPLNAELILGTGFE
jgi:hypothetical protein